MKFLLQATRVLGGNDFTEDELIMISSFMMAVDDEIMNDYKNTCTILSESSNNSATIASFGGTCTSSSI